VIPSFGEFIDSKSLFYKEFDNTTIQKAYELISPHIKHPPAIHLIGTNGKGSTGRAIAHIANKSLKVAHYSSPHILRFNERLWIDGRDASDSEIESAHKELYSLLNKSLIEKLSYFEYTTLLSFVLFQDTDLIVLEAGLGGEYDATTLYKNRVLTLITPIDFDHSDFLGETLEEIATTKLKAISKRALISPQPHPQTIQIAKKIANKIGAIVDIADIDKFLNNPKFQKILSQKGYPKYLLQNIATALNAIETLNIDYDIEDLSDLEIFGRYYPVSKNIRIDVGHNPLGAKAIYEALEDDTILIYNTLKDKDYKRVLSILKPKIKRVEIIEIDSDRAINLDTLRETLRELDIEYRDFEGDIEPNSRYLVFGSFHTVESFLRLKNLEV